jgi:hypothetical protein
LNRATDHRSWTLAGAVILLAVLAVAVAGALATGDATPGRRRAVCFAAGICLVTSLGAWLVGRATPADPARAVGLGMAAVGLRIFPLLVALGWLQVAGGSLRADGAGEWLLVFYLALLATDILLHMMGIRGRRNGGASSTN